LHRLCHSHRTITSVAEKAETPDCFPMNCRDCPRICCLVGSEEGQKREGVIRS
jgi:hypothetical protein